MANRPSRTPEKDALLFAALSEGLSMQGACERAGYGRSSVYEWRQQNKEFSEQFEAAYAAGTEAMEDHARSRAVDGVLEPVGFYKGQHGGTYLRRYSDVLLMFLLKSRDPERFRERSQQELVGPGGGPVALQTDFPKCETVEQFMALVKETADRGAGG